MKTVIFCLFLIVVSLVLLACSSPASIEEGTPTDVFIDTDTAPPPTPLDDTGGAGRGRDDSSPTKNPQAPEVCNGVDDDCDASIDDGLLTTWYVDSDKDGYGDSGGTAQACSEPFGYSSTPGDCDDNSPSSCPECVEVCDGEDNNCDGVVDESPDQDLDGYGSCVDCDDKDLFVHPGIATGRRMKTSIWTKTGGLRVTMGFISRIATTRIRRLTLARLKYVRTG